MVLTPHSVGTVPSVRCLFAGPTCQCYNATDFTCTSAEADNCPLAPRDWFVGSKLFDVAGTSSVHVPTHCPFTMHANESLSIIGLCPRGLQCIACYAVYLPHTCQLCPAFLPRITFCCHVLLGLSRACLAATPPRPRTPLVWRPSHPLPMFGPHSRHCAGLHIFYAFLMSIPIFALFFIDQNLSCLLTQTPCRGLVKGAYYHSGMFFVRIQRRTPQPACNMPSNASPLGAV